MASSANRTTESNDLLATSSNESRAHDKVAANDMIVPQTMGATEEPARTPSEPKCLRVKNIPAEWTTDDLLKALQNFLPLRQINFDQDQLLVHPSCTDPKSRTQVALMILYSPLPDYFVRVLSRKEVYVKTPQTTLSIDGNFLDLTQLNTPKSIVADVVAVHDLGGNAFGSWMHQETGNMWLHDFLPFDIENIRVMTYGYDANLGGGILDETMLDYRLKLLEMLDDARGSPEARSRPIILIGHGMGGIVILQALQKARNDPRYRHIFDRTTALFLFGTPHLGFEVDDIIEMVQKKAQPGSLREKMVAQLEPNSDFLDAMRDNLTSLWSDVGPNFRLFSFYETHPTLALKETASGDFEHIGEPRLLVNRNSAISFNLSFEYSTSVYANHNDMVKYGNEADSTYTAVVRKLRACLDSFGTVSKN